MSKTLIKGNQRTVLQIQSNGDYTITSDIYLTAYRAYGCKTTRTVNHLEGEQIMNRLLNKGFIIA